MHRRTFFLFHQIRSMTEDLTAQGQQFPGGAKSVRCLGSSGLVDGHLTAVTAFQTHIQMRPLTPDSSVNAVDTGLEWIERGFPFKSNFLWSFVTFFPLYSC